MDHNPNIAHVKVL